MKKTILILSIALGLWSCENNQYDVNEEEVPIKTFFSPSNLDSVDITITAVGGQSRTLSLSEGDISSTFLYLVPETKYIIKTKAVKDDTGYTSCDTITVSDPVLNINMHQVGIVITIDYKWQGVYHYNWDTGVGFDCPGDSTCPECHGEWNL